LEKDRARQLEKFKHAARELGCDEDESHFEEKLRKIARHKKAPLGPRGHKAVPKKSV
jgi:hypothetical protein